MKWLNASRALIMLTLLSPLVGIEAVLGQPTIMRMQCLSCESTCNCYWSSDCSSGQYCNWNDCTKSGKKDGVCASSGGGGIGLDGFRPEFIDALDGWFLAYETAADEGTVLPDLEILARAQRASLTLPEHAVLQDLVYNGLDRALGFDIAKPSRCTGEAAEAAIQAGGLPVFVMTGEDAPKGTTEAIRAVHNALISAMKKNDPAAVEGPIRTFWEKYPDFRPHHAGRCWEHGHQDNPYKSPAECQISELRGMLSAIRGRTSS